MREGRCGCCSPSIRADTQSCCSVGTRPGDGASGTSGRSWPTDLYAVYLDELRQEGLIE